MKKEQMLGACDYSKKFFKDNFFQSEPSINNDGQIIVSLPYSYTSISGTKYNACEFVFEYDKRAKRFYFWSYYNFNQILFSDAQNDEILKHIGL